MSTGNSKFKGIKFLEHTADIYVEVQGEDLNKIFERAALALFETIVDTSNVSPNIKKIVEVEGFDLYNLLYKWLEEWLYIHDVEGLVFSKFKVHKIEEVKVNDEMIYKISGEGYGEPLDPKKHSIKTEVKAITYHEMYIGKEGNLYIARFIIDI